MSGTIIYLENVGETQKVFQMYYSPSEDHSEAFDSLCQANEQEKFTVIHTDFEDKFECIVIKNKQVLKVSFIYVDDFTIIYSGVPSL